MGPAQIVANLVRDVVGDDVEKVLAVNEVSRIEVLCEPLGRKVLVSAELAAASGDPGRLEPLGPQTLRGVREPQDIYALRLQA